MTFDLIQINFQFWLPLVEKKEKKKSLQNRRNEKIPTRDNLQIKRVLLARH